MLHVPSDQSYPLDKSKRVSEAIVCIEHISGWFVSIVTSDLVRFIVRIVHTTLHLERQEPRVVIRFLSFAHPSVCKDSFNAIFSRNRKPAVNSKSENNLCNSKLDHFMAYILLLKIERPTFRSCLLLMCVEILSKTSIECSL
jgi:branched-subunit amino acid transport protein